MKEIETFAVRDPSLALQGERSIAWAQSQMGALRVIHSRFEKRKPLKGVMVGMALHVTKETANLALALKAGGADVAIAGCNPLSTQNDVAAALVKRDVSVFAWRGQTIREYYNNLKCVIELFRESEAETLATIDDGLDLVTLIHKKHPDLIKRIRVGTEETTTGVIRLKAMAASGALKYPVIAVNDNQTKHLFDNYYGTGQSTLDGILRATSILFAGKRFVVVGYGDCGKGVAMKAQGMGAHVFVVETDSIRALQAHMDGFEVLTMNRAARIGEVFVTVTGNKHVISLENIKQMKDGTILANAGHFDVEIDVEAMRSAAQKIEKVRPCLEKITINDRAIYLCGEGRLVNLACGEGHPSEVMDLSFTGQALAIEYGVGHALKSGFHNLPESIDQQIAELKLKALGLSKQMLTTEQKQYLTSWQEGT